MAYQKEYLQKVGNEGFQLIDEYYGQSGRPVSQVGNEGFQLIDKNYGLSGRPVSRHPPPPPREREGHYRGKNVYAEPQYHKVPLDPARNSTTYVYHVPNQVPAAKQAHHVTFPTSKEASYSSNLMPATQHHGERNSHQVPNIARLNESAIKGNRTATWYVCRVN